MKPSEKTKRVFGLFMSNLYNCEMSELEDRSVFDFNVIKAMFNVGVLTGLLLHLPPEKIYEKIMKIKNR